MSAKRDYYEVLGVSRNANEVEIKKAYRRLARQYHPDVSEHDGAEAKFKEINEAYEVLSDTQKRAAYDRFGHAGPQAGFGSNGPFEGFDFGLGDIFESFFGGASTRQRRSPQRGADLRYQVNLAFEEAVFGCEKDLTIPRYETCSQCNGSGAEPGSTPVTCPSCNGTGELRRVQQSLFGQFVNVIACERCHGEGRVVTEVCKACQGQGRMRRERKIAVKIPAGIDNDMQIRLAGEGEAGPKGGPAGDLYVAVRVKEHKHFRRENKDIYHELPINVAQAALGDVVTVPTVDGEAEVHIQPGTQSGKSLRLKGRGVPDVHGGNRGDQIVTLRVVTPSNLTEEQKHLLEELARSFGRPLHSAEGHGILNKVKDMFGGT